MLADVDLVEGTGGAISVGLDRAFDLDNDECEARGVLPGTGGAILVDLDRAFDLDNDECDARGVLPVDDDASEPLEVVGVSTPRRLPLLDLEPEPWEIDDLES